MAKRFTHTNKWNDDWFLGLAPKHKCVWSYLLDNCDGAGIIKLSFFKLSYEIGDQVSREEFDENFGDRVVWVSQDTLWIINYIRAQYNLSPTNVAHTNIAKLAIRTVEGHNLSDKATAAVSLLRSLVASSERHHPDIAPTSERLQPDSVPGYIYTDKEKILLKEEEDEKKPTRAEIESVYASYPRKEGKTRGLDRARTDIKTYVDLEDLRRAIAKYAEVCAREGRGIKFILLFSSFMTHWRDWLEVDAGAVLNSKSEFRPTQVVI